MTAHEQVKGFGTRLMNYTKVRLPQNVALTLTLSLTLTLHLTLSLRLGPGRRCHCQAGIWW